MRGGPPGDLRLSTKRAEGRLPVTLTQSDVSELLDAIRAGGDIDVIRRGVELVLQALIDAEATEVIGAGRYERSQGRTTWRNGAGIGCCRPRPATSISRSPSCAREASSRPSWNGGGASTGRCSQ